MTTALIPHPACLEHEPTPGHVESPERLRAVLHALEAEDFAALMRVEAPLATLDDIARVHTRAMIEDVLAVIPEPGSRYDYGEIDGDTFVSPGSREAALRAAGAVICGVDLVVSGEADNAFCAVRPPGHHAEPDRAMGFCLFNNIAIGAAHARARHGLSRIAVVDFDVHHGNGTQAAFERDPDLMYVSSHQWPLYPGTGRPSEHGRYGNILNLPLPAGSGSAEFRAAYIQQGLPALERFAPELLLVSAGFDGHARDSLLDGLTGLDMRLTERDFEWITRELVKVAARSSRGRIVSALEGGYDLRALAASAAAHVAALMGLNASP